MSAHTPGPWRTEQSFDAVTGHPFSSVYATDERGGVHMGEHLPLLIACVEGEGEHIPSEEERANARLIAAAPEMLEFIRDFSPSSKCVDVGGKRDGCWECHCAYCRWRALLAKIDGAATP